MLKVPVFEDGPLEAALYWRKHFEEHATLKGWNCPMHKVSAWCKSIVVERVDNENKNF
jgi:hypothetical protein